MDRCNWSALFKIVNDLSTVVYRCVHILLCTDVYCCINNLFLSCIDCEVYVSKNYIPLVEHFYIANKLIEINTVLVTLM